MDIYSSTSICSEIIIEIMEDVLEINVGEEDCVAANQEEQNEDKDGRSNQGISDSIENIMETYDPFNDSDTQVITCTEIPEHDEVMEISNEAPLGDSNEQKLTSWFDLFKNAYASWGRVEQDGSGKHPDEPTPSTESNPNDDELEDIYTDTGCAEPPRTVVFFRAPIDVVEYDSKVETEEDDNDSFASAEDDNNSFVSAEEVNNSHSDCTDLDQQTETEKEDNGMFDQTEKTVNGIFSEISLTEMNENRKLSESKRDDNEKLAAAETKKVHIRVRKSARLASQLFSDLGSVVKAERVNCVKLLLRRSVRLETSRKRKIKEEGDEAEKRKKKQ